MEVSFDDALLQSFRFPEEVEEASCKLNPTVSSEWSGSIPCKRGKEEDPPCWSANEPIFKSIIIRSTISSHNVYTLYLTELY